MRTAARVGIPPEAVKAVRTDAAAGQMAYFRPPLLYPNGGAVREAVTESASR